MSGGLQVILAGIIIILSSLFCLGLCIMGAQLMGLTLILFFLGLIVCFAGYCVEHTPKDDDDNE